MGPENRSAKHVKHSESRTHSTILLVTHQPTPPTHPPTQQPIDAPTYPPAIQQSTDRRCVDDDTNRVAVTLGFPCIFRLSTTPGSEETLPRRPRSPSRSSAPVLSLANRRAVVWEGRGATARRREAKWGSGVAGFLWECYNQNIIKDPK